MFSFSGFTEVKILTYANKASRPFRLDMGRMRHDRVGWGEGGGETERALTAVFTHFLAKFTEIASHCCFVGSLLKQIRRLHHSPS